MKQFVNLGKSDVEVFPIALGTNAVGGHNLKNKEKMLFVNPLIMVLIY